MIKDFTQDFEIRNEIFTITAPARYDDVTGEMLYDETLDDKAVTMANDAYRVKHGFVFPAELVAFRGLIGLSGRDFSALLGMSQTTIVLYEAGALPTESNNSIIKAMMSDTAVLRKLFEQNQAKMSDKARAKVAEYLGTLPKLENVVYLNIKKAVDDAQDDEAKAKILNFLDDNFLLEN